MNHNLYGFAYTKNSHIYSDPEIMYVVILVVLVLCPEKKCYYYYLYLSYLYISLYSRLAARP
jgi:hypothetical protein